MNLKYGTYLPVISKYEPHLNYNANLKVIINYISSLKYSMYILIISKHIPHLKYGTDL